MNQLKPDGKEQYEQRDHSWFSNAAYDITAERRRQIEKNGYDYLHDDEHINNELVDAALAFAYNEKDFWPWGDNSWKEVVEHNHSKRDMLVRAAALLMAEIERIDRHEMMHNAI